MYKNVLIWPVMIGAGIFSAYELLTRWFRHHDEATNRPRFYDHVAATVIITTVGSCFYYHHPAPIIANLWFSFALYAPITWWYKTQCMDKNGIGKHSNIFYLDGTTPEEVERFRHQDMIESLGVTMIAGTRGAGYIPP